jgi:beta-glucosidase-like glycosyl hydrolase
MNPYAVKTDETGLHALDCECVRCDAGYRPTELERAAARRALALRAAAKARLVLPQPAGRLPGKQEEARVIVPATIEQLNELREERKGFRR